MKIKINKIEKSDTYNGDTVFKIEGSELNWNGTIDVEYGYNDDNKMRIKCYHLTIDAENSVTGEEIQKTFRVIGRWGEKHVRWCTEYQTNWSGFASANDAKKAMIQFIKEWAKIEETAVEAVETPVEETPVDLGDTLYKDEKITVSQLAGFDTQYEYVIQIDGEWAGTVDVEIGYNDQGLRSIKSYYVEIDIENSKTSKKEYNLSVIKDIQGGCDPSKIFTVGYDTPAAAFEATIQFIKSIVKRSDEPVEAVETAQTNNQSTTEKSIMATPQPEEPTMAQSTKIIVVTYHSYIQKWFSFTPENMESILLDFDNIVEIQIIEQGE